MCDSSRMRAHAANIFSWPPVSRRFFLRGTRGNMVLPTRALSRADRTIDRGASFENLSPASEDAFFTVGMQDEIAAELSRLANLKTIGPQSTRSYFPGTHRDLPVIGRELSVRHLLEGSVWRANGEMRISLRLVDLRDPEHPWTGSYKRPVKDVFALQGEITRILAQRLQTPLSMSERAALDKSTDK